MMPSPPVKPRGGGYGLDAELARRAAEKYNFELEAEVQQWIESITGEKFAGAFGDSLADGVLLCKVANVIRPGTIRKIESSKMPFKQMENISNFLKACRKFGVQEFDLFETVDLYEQKDLGVVVQCIDSLGRAIQKNIPEFTGPTLGVKESTANKRSSSRRQVQLGKSCPLDVSMGTAQTTQQTCTDASVSPAYGAVGGTAVKPESGIQAASPLSTSTTVQKAETGLLEDCVPQQVVLREEELSPLHCELLEVEKPSPMIYFSAKEVIPPSSQSSLRSARSPSSKPQASSSPPIRLRGADGYGLDAELARRAFEKYDYAAEQDAQEWIEDVTGETFPHPDDFGGSLQNGVLLCTLMNCIKPGSMKKVETSKAPFKQMENVSNFIKACRAFGVAEYDLFDTVDLYEQKDLGAVVRCLHALARRVQMNS